MDAPLDIALSDFYTGHSYSVLSYTSVQNTCPYRSVLHAFTQKTTLSFTSSVQTSPCVWSPFFSIACTFCDGPAGTELIQCRVSFLWSALCSWARLSKFMLSLRALYTALLLALSMFLVHLSQDPPNLQPSYCRWSRSRLLPLPIYVHSVDGIRHIYSARAYYSVTFLQLKMTQVTLVFAVFRSSANSSQSILQPYSRIWYPYQNCSFPKNMYSNSALAWWPETSPSRVQQLLKYQ